MPSSLDLSLFPSCFSGLAWSAEGDLAVAAGEFIVIATAKENEQTSPASRGKNGWHTTRIRANYFTTAEWPLVFPQNRDDFSIGAEISTSTVVGLSWSPPGLARFRRSVLAVLTSNLILSLWEPIGAKGQWAKVGIVNHALHANQDVPAELEGLDFRKVNIRSFGWCPPLRVPTPANGSDEPPEPESRWGIHMLAVANDANEVALIQVRRLPGVQASQRPYRFEKLAVHSLEADDEQFPSACAGSLLQAALRSKARVTSISCGPWLPIESEEGAFSATAVVDAVYGTQLRLLKATVALTESDPERKVVPRFEAAAGLQSHHPLSDLSGKWASHRMIGPVEWLETNQSSVIALAVGTIGGVFTILIPRALYDGRYEADSVETRSLLFSSLVTKHDELPKNPLDPLSAMTTIRDEERDTCFLHLGTAGGLGAVISFDQLVANGSWQVPRWHKVSEDLREQFDLNRDLGGRTVARVWGLASHRGISAVLFSRHPTDMVEYHVASSEATMIGFAVEDPEFTSDAQSLQEPKTAKPGDNQWEAAITFLLSKNATDQQNDIENQRLVYAAACCALVAGQTESIVVQARQTFEHLAAVTGADLSQEIACCDADSSEIAAKSTEQFSQPGAHLFEWCEICDAGLVWYSPKEAQCANGHIFARCGLSSLAIQEPGISKYCSVCRAEYMDEELVAATRSGQLSSLFMKLFQAFDTCLYCDGKFQGHI